MNYFDSQLKNLSTKKMNFVKPTNFNKLNEPITKTDDKKLRPGMKIRLALSGSGFLAPIHAGAICALLDKNIEIVEVAGTSGGAMMACGVATMWNQEDLLRTALEDTPNGLMSYQPTAILKQGFNNGLILKKLLDVKFSNICFSDISIPLKIVATNINNACPYILSQETTPNIKLSDACRASSSLAFFYTPYYINNIKLVDGGLVNYIPYDLLIEDDIPRFAIFIDMTTPHASTDTMFELINQVYKIMNNEGSIVMKDNAALLGTTIIEIEAQDMSYSNPDLTKDQKYELFMRGYNKVLSMF
jgi:NTE family protein